MDEDWVETTGMSKVTCGCGFVAESPDPNGLRKLYDNHNCSNESNHWLGYIFSFWGVLIVIMLVVGITGIFAK